MRPECSAEATYRENDIPGQPDLRTRFRDLRLQRTDFAIVAQPCGLRYSNDVPQVWRQQAYSCTSFDFWSRN